MAGSIATLLFVFVLVGISTAAHADTVLSANITNAQENPPAVDLITTDGRDRPASFGTATFVLNDAQTRMTMDATIFNIDVTGMQTPDTNDNLTVAHIHRAPVGTNGPVIWGFFGTPFNDTTPNDQVVTPFASGVGGRFQGAWDAPEGNAGATLTNQLPFILSGGTYINFHTSQFPGGEIRGQIIPTPEPSTLVLVGIGIAGAVAHRRWRRG